MSSPSVVLAAIFVCATPRASADDTVLRRVLHFGGHGGTVDDVRLFDGGAEQENDLQGSRRGARADPRPNAPSSLGDCIRRLAGDTFVHAQASPGHVTWRHESSPPTAEARIALPEGILVVRIDPEHDAVTGLRLPDGRTIGDLVEQCVRDRIPTAAERQLAEFVNGVADEILRSVRAGTAMRLMDHIAPPGLACGERIVESERLSGDLHDEASALSRRLRALIARGPGSLSDWEIAASPRTIEMVLSFGGEDVRLEVWRRASGWVILSGLLCAPAP
jgi:hypothetical protein